MPESRALILLGLPRSTLQSWVRENLVDLPERGAFRERDLLEFFFVAVLREEFGLTEARTLWRKLLSTDRIGAYLERALRVESSGDTFVVVVDHELGDIAFCADDDELGAAIRPDLGPRTIRLLPLAERVLRLRHGFKSFASVDPIPVVRRGRPRAASAR